MVSPALIAWTWADRRQDEIDAALDFKNVSIVANYIQSKTQAAQL
jgi:hypothetical protein